MELKSNRTYTKLIDYVFWITFIVFTNPGAILSAFGEDSSDGGINITDVLIVILFGCYVLLPRKNNFVNDKTYSKTLKYLLIFLLYYLIVFGFFVPVLKDNPNYTPFTTFIKIRHGIINVVLVFVVYEFFLRSSAIFFKYFLYSSIVVIVLFLFSALIGVELLPVKTMDRSFVETQRLLMENYGLMPLLIPMGAVAFIFKFDIKYKKIILISFVLMFITWLLSLIRRNIFGTFLYFILALMINNFIQHKAIFSLKKFIKISIYSVILIFFIQLTFPKYLEAGIIAGQETINVIKYGKTTSGRKDARLGLGKDFMQELIRENFIFGTGFDNRWRTSEGDKAGYEASDYPLLSAIAMSGIVGLLFFLPIYIVLLKTLIYDIKYLRRTQLNLQSIESYFFILFIVYFIFDFIQYMNWFLPLSLFSHSGHKSWFVFLAMYLASRKLFYYKENSKKSKLVFSQA